MPKLLQDRFPGIHSDLYTRALRAIPGDVILILPDHQLDALVKGIIGAINVTADDVQKLKSIIQ